MKSFAKIALSVALVAVIVLSIVVASVAWFTSNPEVNANDVTLNSARTLTVTFGSSVEEASDYKYNGQIGNVAEGNDAPYVYEAGGFTVRIDTLSGDGRYGKIKVEFGTVTVSYPAGGTVSDILITDLFHITANVYKKENSGGYVKGDNGLFRAYNSETDGGKDRYSIPFRNLTIASNGELTKTVDNVTSYANFPEGVYELTFTYTFLPEAAYAVWVNACDEPPTADFDDIYGYELSGTGRYIGIVSYTAYQAKYHYDLQRYTKSDTAVNGNYTYTPSDDGGYVRVVTSYQDDTLSPVAKYRAIEDPDTHAITYSSSGEGSFDYIKVGDSNDYVSFKRYNRINGFPYSADKYRGETFTFKVGCSVEEVVA